MSVDIAGADHDVSGRIRNFHCDLSAPVMSADMSQVGVTLFFNTFLMRVCNLYYCGIFWQFLYMVSATISCFLYKKTNVFYISIISSIHY